MSYIHTTPSWRDTVCPTWLAHTVLLEIREQALDSLTQREGLMKLPSKSGTGLEDGWRSILAAQMAAASGNTEESYYRRINTIEKEASDVTLSRWLDVAVTATGLTSFVGVPELPGNNRNANDMTECWIDFHEPDMPEWERELLPSRLLRFAQGLIYADEITEELEAAEAVGRFLQAFAPEPLAVPDGFVLLQNAMEFDEQLAEVAA